MRKLLVALMLVPTMASAEFLSGNDLYNRLTHTDQWWRMYALGYIVGVYDVNVHVTICPKDEKNVTAGQVKDIAEQFLAANPAVRDKSAESLVRESLRRVWPCPTRNPGRAT